jgi:signal transduction histidine kinase
MDHFIRALSHDMTANFMLLDSSFSRLKRSLHTAPREELAQLVEHVEGCLRESKRFLEDMALVARTGSVQMEPSRVDLDELLDEVLFEQREMLVGRRVAVEVRHPLGAVWCHRHRVKQVLTNLLRNAVKHGCSPTEPKITVAAESEVYIPEVGPMLRLCVHDNGPGIAPECHDEIFLPGRRLPQAAGDGSGMGLAIVKQIVEHYGGAVWVDGECPTGTAIVLRLPIPTGEPLPQPHYEPRPVESAKSRPSRTASEPAPLHRHHRSGSGQKPKRPYAS